MKIRCHSSTETVAGDWLRLEREGGAPTVFQRLAWTQAWIDHLRTPDQELLLFSASTDNEPVAIMPMFRRTVAAGRSRLRVLRPTVPEISDYEALVTAARDRDTVVTALLDAFDSQRWDILHFEELAADSPDLASLRRLLPRKPWAVVIEPRRLGCPFLRCPASVAELLRGLGATTRRNLRYYRNRLERAGTVSFETAYDPGGLVERMDAFFRLHALRWRSRGQSGVLGNTAIQSFHTAVARSSQGLLQLTFLVVDTRRIAVHYSYDYRGVRYQYLTGMDPEYAPYRPGSILMLHQLEDAVTRGLEKFDMLRGEPAYKFHFTGELRKNFRVIAARGENALKRYVKTLNPWS